MLQGWTDIIFDKGIFGVTMFVDDFHEGCTLTFIAPDSQRPENKNKIRR